MKLVLEFDGRAVAAASHVRVGAASGASLLEDVADDIFKSVRFERIVVSGEMRQALRDF